MYIKVPNAYTHYAQKGISSRFIGNDSRFMMNERLIKNKYCPCEKGTIKHI